MRQLFRLPCLSTYLRIAGCHVLAALFFLLTLCLYSEGHLSEGSGRIRIWRGGSGIQRANPEFKLILSMLPVFLIPLYAKYELDKRIVFVGDNEVLLNGKAYPLDKCRFEFPEKPVSGKMFATPSYVISIHGPLMTETVTLTTFPSNYRKLAAAIYEAAANQKADT